MYTVILMYRVKSVSYVCEQYSASMHMHFYRAHIALESCAPEILDLYSARVKRRCVKAYCFLTGEKTIANPQPRYH